MKHNYIPEIKKALEGTDEELINLFYILDENNYVTDITELCEIMGFCQEFEVPMGFTFYDLISGKVDSDVIKLFSIKDCIDEDMVMEPIKKEKKKKESKFEKENKIVLFKNKDKKDD